MQLDRAPCDEGVKIIRGLCAAPILQTVFAAAELRALRRVNSPKADPCAVNFKRIAVDDAGLPDQVISQRRAPK